MCRNQKKHLTKPILTFVPKLISSKNKVKLLALAAVATILVHFHISPLGSISCHPNVPRTPSPVMSGIDPWGHGEVSGGNGEVMPKVVFGVLE